jgi:hypothetical protein
MNAGRSLDTPTTGTLSHRQVLVVFSGLMLGMFLAALDGTIAAAPLQVIALVIVVALPVRPLRSSLHPDDRSRELTITDGPGADADELEPYVPLTASHHA